MRLNLWLIAIFIERWDCDPTKLGKLGWHYVPIACVHWWPGVFNASGVTQFTGRYFLGLYWRRNHD
jgi:hypothetical protein